MPKATAEVVAVERMKCGREKSPRRCRARPADKQQIATQSGEWKLRARHHVSHLRPAKMAKDSTHMNPHAGRRSRASIATAGSMSNGIDATPGAESVAVVLRRAEPPL